MFKWFANLIFPRNKKLGYVDESVERNTIKHKPIIQRESVEPFNERLIFPYSNHNPVTDSEQCVTVKGKNLKYMINSIINSGVSSNSIKINELGTAIDFGMSVEIKL